MFFVGISASGADPTATNYTPDQCRGSAMPYPAVTALAQYPDSLSPVMINHVGRHGARYPANSRNVDALISALQTADSLRTITPLGRELLKAASDIRSISKGRWGALDSLGIAEQWGIASRMYASYPTLFGNATIQAISSYSPRCIMSMYSFLHQVTRLNNNVEIQASSGRNYSPLMRFFDLNPDYTDYARGDSWRQAYTDYCATQITDAPLRKLLGAQFPFESLSVVDLSMSLYSTLACTAAIGYPCDIAHFVSPADLNALWRCFNLRQYLLHSCSTVSSLPMEIASPLLNDLINSTDRAISSIETGQAYPKVNLRFGHAETLMPLLALMRLSGCYYLTNYFDTVGMHWRDFAIVPMAANIQMILFKSEKSGRYYLRVDLNENPTPLIPGTDAIYLPWEAARGYLVRCLPIYYQD